MEEAEEIRDPRYAVKAYVDLGPSYGCNSGRRQDEALWEGSQW